jgi:CRP-like cAMP-binding protein
MSQGVLNLAEPPLAGVRDRLLLLRSLETLAGLDDEALTLLAEHSRYRTFPRGYVLCEADAPVTALHIVIDGSITVTRENSAPFKATAGDGLGVLPLIAGVPGGRMISEEEARTLEIPASVFQAALEDNFSLLRNELRLFSLAMLRARGRLPRAAPAPPATPPTRSLTVVERVMQLRESPLGVMSVDALTEFARRMVEVRIAPDQVVWTCGESPLYSLYLQHGLVRCTTADGTSVDVGGTTMLGELDAWSMQDRSYTLTTLTEVVAWRVSSEDLLMVLESHIQPAIQMLANVSRQLLASSAYAGIALTTHRAADDQAQSRGTR